MTAIRVGVAGAGGIGQHHVRLLSEMEAIDFVGVHDPRREAAEDVASRFGAAIVSSFEELVAASDAIVLAVPTVHHADLGCHILESGRHLLVEKPIASSLEEADRLLAAAGDRVLAAGHVEFHNPAVQALLGRAQNPRYVEIERLAVFTPRSLDVDVILDLMIHDLQILHALDPTPVVEIRATGIDVLTEKIDIASCRLVLESGCVANVTASRVSSERIRKLRTFLGDRYYSLDYHLKEVRGYCLQDLDGSRVLQPDDLTVAPGEPLKRELESFIAAIRGEDSAIVDGSQARRALGTALDVLDVIGKPG